MSSAWRRRSGFTSRIDTSAPRPTAVRAALRRAVPDRVGGGQRRADGGVLVVTDPAAPAGAALDDDTVAGFGEGSGAGGRQRDARFARLDLARDPDDHRAPKAATDPRIGRLSRSARARPSPRSISPHV